MMTTSRTADDLARRTLFVMRYFCSSSAKFLCHRSSAVCMLERRSEVRGQVKMDTGPPTVGYLVSICCRSCSLTSLAFALRASRTALSSSETTGRRRAVLSQIAISLLSSATCGGSLFLRRT